jgi:deoxycytidylate deaminase
LGGSRLRRQLFPCIACTRVHLVNLKIGKVLGEDND